MSISVEKRSDEDLTLFIASGELTFQEQMDVIRPFYESNPSSHVIWDFRNISGTRITPRQLQSIIAFTKKHAHKRKGGKTALITSSDLDYGLSRMSSMISENSGLPWEIRPFRDFNEALLWIQTAD